MRIQNARIFTGGGFVTGDLEFDRTIEAVGKLGGGGWDAQGRYVTPGLVDIHTHGAVGADFSDGDAAALVPLSRHYASRGVTSFLATTMTLPEAQLRPAMEAVASFVRPEGGAKCAGVHLEGPFLSHAKRGAQAAAHLHRPDLELFYRLDDASGGNIRLVTVAPEEPGAMALIRGASQLCAVSLGHTTADFDTAIAAFQSGATHATHLFNGMPPLHHREPGVIGAALDAGASVELIVDGQHIHPSVVRAVSRLFGNRLTLVSDSLRCAGMPDGPYTLGGQPIFLKDGKAALADGTLAGSCIGLLDAVRNAVRFGVSLPAALYAATTAPAQAARLPGVGALTVGSRADLLVLDEHLQLERVYIDGILV